MVCHSESCFQRQVDVASLFHWDANVCLVCDVHQVHQVHQVLQVLQVLHRQTLETPFEEKWPAHRMTRQHQQGGMMNWTNWTSLGWQETALVAVSDVSLVWFVLIQTVEVNCSATFSAHLCTKCQS
jgi:hypothetical protein